MGLSTLPALLAMAWLVVACPLAVVGLFRPAVAVPLAVAVASGAVIFFAIEAWFVAAGVWYLVGLGATALVFALFLPRGIWGFVEDRFGLHLLPVGYRLRFSKSGATPNFLDMSWALMSGGALHIKASISDSEL